VREQRLQLGREDQLAVRQNGVLERLDAEPVAGEEQGLLRLIPEREREHAAEVRDAGLAPFLPGMDDDLGVGCGAEAVAARAEGIAQLAEIVNLAVVDDDHRAVLVEHRLGAGREVDDRQAGVREPDARRHVHALAVGTAVRLGPVHPVEQPPLDRRPAARIEDADEAAHCRVQSSGCASAARPGRIRTSSSGAIPASA
jgi:hypothetical protein